MSVHQRFNFLVEKLELNPNQLAKKLGITRPTVHSILNGSSLPSAKVLMPLIENYPNVNLNWLLSGKGEMLIDENQVILSKDHLNRLADSLERENNMLRKEINGLAEELERIQKIVEALPDED